MNKLKELEQEVLDAFHMQVVEHMHDIKYNVLENVELVDEELGVIKKIEIDGNEVDIRSYLNNILRKEIKKYESSKQGSTK